MTNVTIVIRNAPFNGQSGQEAVDLILAASTFGQQVSVAFVDDGVFQLCQHQNPAQIQRKHFAKSFGAFEFYDVEDVYVCQQSLSARKIDEHALLVDAQILSTADFSAKLHESEHILNIS